MTDVTLYHWEPNANSGKPMLALMEKGVKQIRQAGVVVTDSVAAAQAKRPPEIARESAADKRMRAPAP